MKIFICLLMVAGLAACGKSANTPPESVEFITSVGKQDSVFKKLLAVTHYSVPRQLLNDSLAFLVLPVHASCPACRNKTIDSILKHQGDLRKGRFIIVSANGGYKNISSYFRERGSEIPDMKDRLFLDSTNQGYQYDLYDKNPEIYYAFQQKAYKKITAIPATVKEDLREFFSGYRKHKKSN